MAKVKSTIYTKTLNFNIMLKPEREGGFTVVVPSLPGCVTYGKNLIEAKRMAQDAIRGYVQSLVKHNEPVPSDEFSFVTTVQFDIPVLNKKLTYA